MVSRRKGKGMAGVMVMKKIWSVGVMERWRNGTLVACGSCLLMFSVTGLYASPVSSWDFNGSLNDAAGQNRDNLSAVQGAVRYVTAKELPGVNGKAVAIGVASGDAQSLRTPASADVKLGANYSIEAWVLPTDISQEWQRFVLNWGQHHGYHFAIHHGKVSLYHAQADAKESFAEGGKVRVNRWNHIVGIARRNDKEPSKSKLEVYLNGRLESTATYDGTIRTLAREGLGIGDSAGAQGGSIRYRGYVDEINIWNRALTPAEISSRVSVRKQILDLPTPEVASLKHMIQDKNSLEMVIRLEEGARKGTLTGGMEEVAAELLDHEDIYIRSMAEWAIARRVGRDNNHEEVNWTESSDAPWFKKWLKVSVNDRIEMDWCRQAVSLGIHNDAGKLKASVDTMISRIRSISPTEKSLQDIRARMDKAEDISELRQLWIEARRANRPYVFAMAKLGFDEIVLFNRHTLHYKPNVCGVHTSWSYKPGGDVVVVSGLEKHQKEESLIKSKLGPGHVHGMDLSFDKKKIVFSWAQQPEWPPRFSTRWPRGGNDCYAFELRNTTIPPHLYEMDIEKGEIVQLTDHNFWTDVEPVCCPDGTIAFTSDRTAHSPSCDGRMNDLTDHNIYSLSADRKRIRRLTNQKDVDMHPHLLENGLIAYLRWEYQERHFWDVHSVWTVKPDGTMSDALFKQHLGAPLSVRDARSIPGTSKLVAIAAGHHALPKGPVVILDPTGGINEQKGIQILTMGSRPQETSRFAWKRDWDKQAPADGGVRVAGGFFMMPYAVSEKAFLVSYGYGNREARRYGNHHADVDSNGLGIYLIDSYGNMELVYRSPLYSCYGVIPYEVRKKPAVLPDMVDMSKNYATCVIPDVYEGLDGVDRGVVKYIRISEALPWPIVPGEGVKRWDLSNRWCPVRVIGTVPVEEDGSAHFKVPVADNASVYFQALDDKHMEVRRMRSSISFQPGERRSCNGCHETKAGPPSRQQGKAVKRAPDMPKAPEWGANRQLAFDWMIQPILDKRCIGCHGAAQPEKGLNFTKGQAYQTIMKRRLVSVSPREGDGSITVPYQYGSHKSRLITQLLKPDTPCKATLNESEWIGLVTWVDANAPNRDMMHSKRTADGRNWVWEPYDWKDIWAQPAEVPAKGEYLALPANKWLDKLSMGK